MGKKVFSWIGMICGVAVIILGILVMSGSFGGNASSYTPWSSSVYPQGFASFGADFYSYVSNNAADAASAARTTANNLDKIADLIKSASGVFLMAFGAFMFCLFGTKLTDTPRVTVAPAAPAPEVEPVQQGELYPVGEGIRETCQSVCDADAADAPEDTASDSVPEKEASDCV